ncbi:sulfotransferase domain-containing protein [Thioalkalivibrio sp. ALMg13-2]|uniref:sulfotransferase domain-containing protein n=1 Tax=Thioalkalivibrio sp. ALMg13-2 TaxID=1158167 RepID=UPI001E56A111|nr:sulfotransferase domain-containing protein [Thioalkalivibrio sp. ALMg13-2]
MAAKPVTGYPAGNGEKGRDDTGVVVYGLRVALCLTVFLRVSPNMLRIHIVGSGPRTGTTLLAEAMGACFEIDEYCEHEAPVSREPALGAEVALTKEPADISVVRWPLQLDPSLHVICIVRDPRDSIVSVHRRAPDRYYSNLRFWKVFVRHFRYLESHPRFHGVRYEDLVHNPDAIQERLERRVPGLVRRHAFSQFHEVARPGEKSVRALHRMRPMDSASVGHWRDHLPRVKQQILEHGEISADLVRFGYEADSSWEAMLDGVEPGGFKSVLSAKRNWRMRARRSLRLSRAVANALLKKVGLPPRVVFYPMDKPLDIVRQRRRR